MLAEIFSEGGLIVVALIALIFAGAKLPQLARNLGSAKKEFEKGLKEGDDTTEAKDEKKAEPKAIEKGSESNITQQTKGETTA